MFYKITNKSKQKIRVRYAGKTIELNPGKFIVTARRCEIKKLDKFPNIKIEEVNPKDV